MASAFCIDDALRSIDRPARRVMLRERHDPARTMAAPGCFSGTLRGSCRIDPINAECSSMSAREMRLSPNAVPSSPAARAPREPARGWLSPAGGHRRLSGAGGAAGGRGRWWLSRAALSRGRGARSSSRARGVSRAASRGRGGHGQPASRGGRHREAPRLRLEGEARSLRNAEIAGIRRCGIMGVIPIAFWARLPPLDAGTASA
jgi:hypothetical protein